MKKAAIYVRVSSDKQDYQRQITELSEIAKRDGYGENDIIIYSEVVSGFKANEERPQFALMLNNLSNYECIYFSELTRLGRNAKMIRDNVDFITGQKVNIFIQNHSLYLLDKDGKMGLLASLLIAILAELASNEIVVFKERSKSGMLQSARNGKAGGGISQPYGYKKDASGMLVIDEEEAGIVKEIFESYLKGYGLKIIGYMLNEKGIPTRMAKHFGDKPLTNKIKKPANKILWSETQIATIIKNTLYIGERRFKGHIIPAPAIISKGVFDKCQQLLIEKNRPAVGDYTYLLYNLCTCGICGKNYVGKWNPPNYTVYMCVSRQYKGCGCANRGINIELIESVVFDVLQLNYKIMEISKNVRDEEISINNNMIRIEKLIEAEKKALNEKANTKKRLIELYTGGIISMDTVEDENRKIVKETDAINLRIKKLNAELKVNHDNIQARKSNTFLKNHIQHLKANRGEMSVAFHELVKSVIITGISNYQYLIRLEIKGQSNPLDLIINKGREKKNPLISYLFAKKPIKYNDGVLVGNASRIVEDIIAEAPKIITNKDESWIDKVDFSEDEIDYIENEILHGWTNVDDENKIDFNPK